MLISSRYAYPSSRFFSTVLLALAFSPAFAATQFPATQWSIKDLGVLPGGSFTQGTALNDSGQVVGFGDLAPQFNNTGERIDRPFAFISGANGGALKVLDSGPADAFLNNFIPVAVNNVGQVAGTATQGSSFPYAFVTGPDGTSLDFVTGDATTSGFAMSTDINNSGEVLYESLQGAVRVVQPDGSITEIRSAGEPGAARAINDAGQVALNSQPDPLTAQVNGFVWSEADGFEFVRADCAFSEVYDINNAGQTLAAGADGTFIADADGTALDFLDLPDGSSINNNMGLPKFNDSGQVIGLLQADGDSFAFVTGANGDGLINLEILPDIMQAGWSGLRVMAINNLGQIAGTGTINGTTRAFFLAPVPEPETYALMLAGLGVIAWAGKRRNTKSL